MKMTKEEQAIYRWLKGRFRYSERWTKKKVCDGEYGEAQLSEGMTQVYAFAILWLESKAKHRRGLEVR